MTSGSAIDVRTVQLTSGGAFDVGQANCHKLTTVYKLAPTVNNTCILTAAKVVNPTFKQPSQIIIFLRADVTRMSSDRKATSAAFGICVITESHRWCDFKTTFLYIDCHSGPNVWHSWLQLLAMPIAS